MRPNLTNMTTLCLKKSIRRSPSRIALLLIPLVFACFAPLQRGKQLFPRRMEAIPTSMPVVLFESAV